jgi:DHA1 family tetracycline resistance protein-like MFS transporter
MNAGRQAAIGFIFVTILIDTIGFGIIIPVLPNLIIELTHGTTSEAARIGGWLLFAFAIVQFLFAPILGGLSDRFGRRPILLGSLFGFGLDYIFLALAPTLPWLFLGRIIAGALGASFTTAAAYIADISSPEKRGQNFGMMGAAFGLGFVIGPAIGGLLGAYGSRVPFLAAAGLSLLNWLYGYFVLPESLKTENRRPFNWKRANPVGSLMNLKRYPGCVGVSGFFGAHLYCCACSTKQLVVLHHGKVWLGPSHDWNFIGGSGTFDCHCSGRINKNYYPRMGTKEFTLYRACTL